MKTDLKYANGHTATKKADVRDLLWVCALLVIGINLLCTLALSPLSRALTNAADAMAVDVELEGGALHIITNIGAQVLFYLSGFLATAAFFIGAGYIARFAMQKKTDRALGSAVITYIGVSVGTLTVLIAFFFLRLSDGAITLSEPVALLYDVLFSLLRVGGVLAATLVMAKKGVKAYIHAIFCAAFMFLCAAGLELVENIPFFLKGMMLSEDVVNIVISMLLYALHAAVGFFVMMRVVRK
jgi:hypothetical protein